MKKHDSEKSSGKGFIAQSAHESFMSALEERKFFGIVETHFENGGIVRLRKIETLVPRDVEQIVTI